MPVPDPASPPVAPAPTRALAPDLARGWMLLLIAIANVSAYLWGHDVPPLTSHPVDGSTFDRVLSTATILFVDGRVYPMFAFLFGYGMVQFARSREDRGVPEAAVHRMLRRRHWWLLAFGFAHAALLFAGDILGAYGLAGLVLTAALFQHSDRVLRGAVWTMLSLFVFGAASMLGLAALMPSLAPESAPTISEADPFGSDADPSGVADYGRSVLLRAGLWVVATPTMVLSLLVPVCIVLGWLAGRHRWLELSPSRLRLGPVAFWGILTGAVAAVPLALTHLGVWTAPEPVVWALALLGQLAGVAGGVGYAALFGLLGARPRTRAGVASRAVSALGARSLSGYLLQSAAFAPLLSAWGLGLGACVGTTAAFGIAAAVWALSLLLAVILERRSARGPAEALLRRLTSGRLIRVPGGAPAR